MQRAHLPEMGENGSARSSSLHAMLYPIFFCFSVQTNLLREVWLSFSFLNECLCIPSLALNVVEHNPVYKFSVWSFCVTVASYTTFFKRHLPSKGQGVFLGQQHVLSSGGGVVRSLAFLLEMIFSMFGVQL